MAELQSEPMLTPSGLSGAADFRFGRVHNKYNSYGRDILTVIADDISLGLIIPALDEYRKTAVVILSAEWNRVGAIGV